MAGRLFLVVGPSCAGKDSQIGYVVSRAKRARVARRVITRQASDTEDFLPVTKKRFGEMKREGAFAFSWRVYGKHYGVPVGINKLLSSGVSVLVNVSRAMVPKIKRLYSKGGFGGLGVGVRVVLVSLPVRVVERRLRERGREGEEEMEERIMRAKEYGNLEGEADLVVSGYIKKGGPKFLKFVKKEMVI